MLDKTSKFISQANKVHDSKYDYSKSLYIDARSKVAIQCPIHGEFLQLPRKHLSGQQCPTCAVKGANNYRRLTYEQFIHRANQIHGTRYVYGIYKINNMRDKIAITCKTHGVFTQSIVAHLLHGSGCRLCQKPNTKPISTNAIIYDTKWFIDKAQKLYGSYYDYSAISYDGSESPVQIICPLHGEFKQAARDHLQGFGCSACGINRLSELNRKDFRQFIAEATVIHGSQYDYTKSHYINQDTQIDIVCKDHGVFTQNPRHHLRGQGCQKCAISSGQNSLYQFINTIYDGVIQLNNRDILDGKEIDIYLPAIKLGVEYHGLYFHSFNIRENAEDRARHAIKTDLCNIHEIKLLQIFENEWINKRRLIESMLKHQLKLSHKIHARQCNIVKLNNREYMKYMAQWHLAGGKSSHTSFGLQYNNTTISAIGFNVHKQHGWEITRYATALDHVIVGGFSKLFNAFSKEYDPIEVMTYADRRISTGNCYQRAGFVQVAITRPNYFYVKGGKLYSRIGFQKHKLPNKLQAFDAAASESTNMFNNGYRRIWDAGHLKLIWRKHD